MLPVQAHRLDPVFDPGRSARRRPRGASRRAQTTPRAGRRRVSAPASANRAVHDLRGATVRLSHAFLPCCWRTIRSQRSHRPHPPPGKSRCDTRRQRPAHAAGSGRGRIGRDEIEENVSAAVLPMPRAGACRGMDCAGRGFPARRGLRSRARSLSSRGRSRGSAAKTRRPRGIP